MNLSHLLFLVVILTTSIALCKKDICYENLCERHGKYPKKLAKKINSMLNSKNFKIKTDSGPKILIQPFTSIKISSRIGSEEKNMCETKTETYKPVFDTITNSTIVNTKNYEQKIEVNICVKNQTSNCWSRLLDYKGDVGCKQVFSNVRFLVYAGKDKFAHKLIKVPTGCVCSYTK